MEQVIDFAIIAAMICIVGSLVTGGVSLAFGLRGYSTGEAWYMERAIDMVWFAVGQFTTGMSLSIASAITISIWNAIERRRHRRNLARRLG